MNSGHFGTKVVVLLFPSKKHEISEKIGLNFIFNVRILAIVYADKVGNFEVKFLSI